MKNSITILLLSFLIVMFSGFAFAQVEKSETQTLKSYVCHVLAPAEKRGYADVVVTFRDITAIDKENAVLKSRDRLQNPGTNLKAQDVLYRFGINNVDFLCIEK